MEKNRVFSLLTLGYKHSKFTYIIYSFLMILFGISLSLIIKLQERLINIVMNDIEIKLLIMFVIGYFLLFYIETISKTVSSILKTYIYYKIERKEVCNFIKDISILDFKEYESSETHNTIMRITKTQSYIINKSISFLPIIIKSFIELGTIFYFMIFAGVWWGFPLGIIISLPAFYFNKKRIQYAREVWNQDNKKIRYAEYLNDTLLNKESSKERRFFGFYEYFSNLWESTFKEYNKNKINNFMKSSIFTAIAMSFSIAIVFIIGLTLLTPLKSGAITIGLYTALLIAVSSKMNRAITTIIAEYTSLNELKYYLDDYKKLNDLEKIEGGEVTNLNFESLEFIDVWFKYPNSNNYILKGVSFKIKNNDQVALIGVNGAGKTTITKLMLGLFKPSKGKILLNNKNIESYSYKDIQSIYVNLQQDFSKYKASIKENISLYRFNEPVENDMESLKQKCDLNNILSKVNNDLDKMLSPEFKGGVMLSGGEWQRIALARMIYSNRDFFILDEPTAALDPLAEIKFYDTYKNLTLGHTCLFITHRLGSTYLFEKCLVLSDGLIIEEGSHDELMNKNGLYKSLYNKQKTWYLNKGVSA